MATRVAPSKQTEVDSTHRQKRRHIAKYQEEAGKYTKVLNICAWDRDASGQLKMFESEKAVLEHEASCGERRKQGEYPAGGYAKLGEVLLKLAQNIQENNQIEHDETRDVVREEAEKVRGDLDAIRKHLDGKTDKQLQLAEKRKQQNEAFDKRVGEAGDCTPLEQAQFELAVAQAKVRAIKENNRKIKEDSQIKEKREKAKRATASASLAGPPASKRRHGESSEEGGGPETV